MTTTPTTPAADTAIAPAPAPRTTRIRTAVLAAVGVLVGAGITAGLVLGLGGDPAAQPAAPTAPAIRSSAPIQRHPAAPAPAAHPKPAPAPAPSAAIETLQRELGQLNYYEGPVTGTMNSQTVAAITYLQRDAHLPQTGAMNIATQQALVTMLANGNNQMGS